ncbi:MAG: hypothetical protein MUE44_23000 [Oscillatoriaceae cyanobacterium Prado104]|jgi:hypothetical protein|nr:hypothetical protein [Oscillatoriaceae cyanobacterium Prado104]
MNENRTTAYLQLIYNLLNCPNGQETQILEDNSELLDREFLDTCELVAETMTQQGGVNGAQFLRNLASRLAEFIDTNVGSDGGNSDAENFQEYAKFFLELLQAEQDSNSDAAVIYPMLAERQHLLNARFAETLQQVAQRLLDGENQETISSLVALIEKLSDRISELPGDNRANNIEIAIAGYQIVLNNREPGSEKFLKTQNNLALVSKKRVNNNGL